MGMRFLLGVSLRVVYDVPLRYQVGKLNIVYFVGWHIEVFDEFFKEYVGFAHGLYYKVPNVELEMGLVRVKTADTTIMDGVVAKWRVEYDEESMQTEEAAVHKKSIEIGLTNQVERTTQEEAVQGEDNQQQQQDNPVEHDNPETAIYVE
ncbi:hypothetical protein Tco_0753706 [Tanacetum coccineum]